MRALLTFIPAFLAAQTVARKSLSVAVHLPHTYYSTESTSYFHDAAVNSADPYDVAKAFLLDLLGPNVTYVIRDDSYTDAVSGITHIYASQRVAGVDVAAGNINLNIRRGVVLSHGNSFYSGPQLLVPDAVSSTFDPYLAFCNNLRTRLRETIAVQNPSANTQTHLTQQYFDDDSHTLSKRFGTYCAHFETAPNAFQDLTPSVETALLYFLVVATADPSLSESIVNNPLQHLRKIDTSALQESGSYAISGVPGTVGDVIADIVYAQVPDTDSGNIVLELAHRFKVRLPLNSYEAYVSVDSPHRILSVVDCAYDGDPHTDILESDDSTLGPLSNGTPIMQGKDSLVHGDEPLPEVVPSTYKVFKWGFNDPDDALNKSGVLLEKFAPHLSLAYDEVRTVEAESVDPISSPVGWHTLPMDALPYSADGCHDPTESWCTTDTTFGNNVFVQGDWKDTNKWRRNKRPVVAPNHEGRRIFNFSYNPVARNDKPENVQEAHLYLNASATQAFYLANMVHDLFYRYGFDELGGNFQQWNFHRGGEQDDAIILDIQKSEQKFNWGFMTVHEDGVKPTCYLHLYDHSTPYRDSAMSSDVLIHELTHGLTSRLIGGPKLSNCLGKGESRGMSEGFSDYVAVLVRANDPHTDYTTGDWILNSKGGARKHPYTLDLKKNPTTYENVSHYAAGVDPDHDIGTIWTEMLWTATATLSDKHGFSQTLLPPARLPDGSFPSSAFEGPSSFYLPWTDNPITRSLDLPVPRHGNTLMLQLVINSLKLLKCPVDNFLHGRDTIILADKLLTGGVNNCELWATFAQRGLGVDAKNLKKGPLADDVERINGFEIPDECEETIKKLK